MQEVGQGVSRIGTSGSAAVSASAASALARIVIAADGQPNADARQRVLMIQWPRMVELACRVQEGL